MAPALSEPISPTEKLTNSTAKVTPSTRTNKDASDTGLLTSSTIITGCNNNEHKEKRARSCSISTPIPSSSASISPRLTRSKDAYQRVFEQAVTPTASVSPPPIEKEVTNTSTAPKNSVNSVADGENDGNSKHTPEDGRRNNESIGLSGNLHNKNIDCGNDKNLVDTIFSDEVACETRQKDVESNFNNNNNASISCKSKSTEQLLADLTNDIEESITTKVCIRKPVQDLTKEENVSNASLEPNDLAIIKGGDSEARETNASTDSIKVQDELQRMDSGLDSGSGKSESFIAATKAPAQKVTAAIEKKKLSDEGAIRASSNSTVVSTKISTEELQVETEKVQVTNQKLESVTRLQILSVDVLPPISTDSTMTASEVEDNLEERLSQLDGTAIASPNCEVLNPITASDGMVTIVTTPPRTPIKQQTQQQQVQQLQQQLQQTPPTPLSHQIHQQQHLPQQHTFTPQSSTSSANTLNSTNLPPAFMKETGAGELEDQDIEEVLKVLKGFDGSAGADTLCDLNVLFNEEYTLNYDEVSSQPASTSTKPNPLKDMQIEIERNQQAMHRRIDFLLRRMRKLQARYMSKHCSEEIAGLFEWTARISAGKGGPMNNTSDLLRSDTAISVIAARPPADNWAEEKNPVASTQMSSMLRRLEHSSTAQQLCMVSANSSLNAANTQLPRKTKKALLQEMQAAASTSAATTAIASTAERKGEVVVPHYDINVSEEMAQVAGLLQTEMREVQTAMDSDATESSSGGESADEMVTYNNQIQQPLAIAKRAAWRYSRDRAAIAARWSWLLSQIADLEIKIRQHTELRQEVVRTKGAVASGLDEQYATIHAGNLKSIEVATLNTTTSSVNGYKGNMLGNTGVKFDAIESEEAGLIGAARTRGFVPSLFRKRKLLQTQSLHTISKKAARPSNIKCGCQWPFNPCALCTGRTDPTAPRDPPDTMMMADRIALLDPGYHPVLSFREDVNCTLHLEAIARMPEWQQRIMRCQVKSIAKSVWKAEREAERAAGHNTSKKYNEPVVKRRYTKKKDRLAAEEKNAAAAAAAAATSASGMTTNASTSSGGGPTADLSSGTVIGGGSGGVSADTSAHSATSTTLPACDGGNGTGTLSTSTTTTPLVANISAKNSKKLHHYHLVGDGVLLEPPRPLSPVPTNHSSHSQSSHHSQQSGNSNSNYIHQTSDNPPQNYDQYSPSPAHSSLISNNSNGFNGGGGVGGSSGIGGNHKQNNKYRKSSASSGAGGSVNNSGNNNNTSFYYQNNHLSSHYATYTGESNDANWDGFVIRSRTSSPTHAGVGGGSNNNYHKYERSKNRTSYDIDNIVIPYSVAASTRVEILQYKEIPTPKWRVIDEDRGRTVMLSDEPMETASASGVAKCDSGEGMDIDGCENMLVESKTSSDSKSGNSVDVVNGLEVDIKAVEEKTSKVVNATEECGKLNVCNGSETADGADALIKSGAPIVSTTKISEQRNNNFIKNDCNALVKTENKNITVQNTSTAVDSISDEPVVKKAKTEHNDDNKMSSVDKVEVKPENVRNSTFAASKIPKTEATAAFKRAKRFKRVSTIQEESFDIDAAAEAAEPEDITYDAIMLRHERALTEERRKFQTYLKFPWSTRSRANRRIDSRAESSGANTPDPTSPAPQSLGGGDQESIPSPLAPCTPLNPLDTISEAGENGASNLPANSIISAANNTNSNDLSKRLERRRTTSTKRERELERRSSTPDPRELVPPYEPLQFPLTDEAFEGLLKAMPVEFHCLDFDAKYLEDCNNTGGAVSGSKYSRQRSSWRSDVSAVSIRRGKLASTTQNCDVTSSRKQRINNNGGSSGRKGINGGRGRRRGNNAITKTNDELMNGVHAGDEEEDAEDDDVDLMMLLAEEADDYDYPKHHLAPDDDLLDSGSGNAGGGVALNGNARNRMMDIEDEYEAYLGRRHRDSDAETTDSDPFADDDPNDPEWRGESEDRGGGGGGERNRRTVR
ncbi:uncharacterized protein LOC118744675 isoform X1 [Rhagoletis pomonella]|uniref:uncharacterized protein LOC118744675 isoform X1 n=1 Tax=Rhagoletis pomonella TaxID=28610 RepID=UPI00177EF234|nr:uncharacterized protein LOC118744675 isoform X1 [Rhagoletis pomonella]